MNKKNFLKGAGVLLITAVMIMSTLAVTANTNEVQKQQDSLVSTAINNQEHSLSRNKFMQTTNDVIFHQQLVDPNGDWAFINCDSTLGYGGIENFQITEDVPIQTVALYGLPLYHDGVGWVAFPPEDVVLDVVFYDDDYSSSPTVPSDIIATFIGIDTFESIDLLDTYVGYSAYKWTFELPQSVIVTGQDGWLQIEAPSGFMWGNSLDGDLSSYQYGVTPPWLIDDRAMTLYGEGGTPSIPDLDCTGSLNWADVSPGDTVSATFTVSNVGDPTSLLNWEIESFPDWGNWTFTPANGVGLTPEDGDVIITVEVVAPDDPETEFSGEIIIVNSDDGDDTCTIDVILATPFNLQSHSATSPFMSKTVTSTQPKPMNRDIIWDNGDDDGTGNGISSQNDLVYPFNSQVADDFLLDEAADIEGVQWWGQFWNGANYPVTTEFNVIFYADDGTGTMPTGAGLDDPTPTALEVYNFPSVTGTSVGTDRYEYQVTLPTPFSADAGTKYWIAIQWVGTFSDYGQWGWVDNGANPDQLHESVQGFPMLEMDYWTDTGYGDVAFILYGEGGSQPEIPDLDCEGSLNWADITPGATVSGTFTVSNVGDAGSLLDWEIQSYPDWGTWTFTPENGVDLTPEDGALSIAVEVVAPMDKETEFTGQIIVVNSDDTSDTCTIEVVLATPVSYQSPLMVFFQRLVQRFPLLSFIFNLL